MAKTSQELLAEMSAACDGVDIAFVLEVLQHMMISVYNQYRAHGRSLDMRGALQQFLDVIDAQLASDEEHRARVVAAGEQIIRDIRRLDIAEPGDALDDDVPPDRVLH